MNNPRVDGLAAALVIVCVVQASSLDIGGVWLLALIARDAVA